MHTYKAPEAMKLLRLSQATFYRMVRRGEIGKKVGGTIRVSHHEIEKFLGPITQEEVKKLLEEV